MLKPFLIAIQFLTRLPVSSKTKLDESVIGKSLLFYPAVGLIIGAILYVFYVLLQNHLSYSLLSAILLALWVLITGALHYDGLADSADAWVGGMNDRQKTLDIMKDPRSGPIAVVTICLTLIIKYAALEQILTLGHSQILLLAPVLGRAAIVALFISTEYVRPGGLGEYLANAIPYKAAKQVLLVVLIVVFFLDYGFWLIIGAGLCFILLRTMMLRRLQGCTGDTAGAMVEWVEMSVLVTMAICIRASTI